MEASSEEYLDVSLALEVVVVEGLYDDVYLK